MACTCTCTCTCCCCRAQVVCLPAKKHQRADSRRQVDRSTCSRREVCDEASKQTNKQTASEIAQERESRGMEWMNGTTSRSVRAGEAAQTTGQRGEAEGAGLSCSGQREREQRPMDGGQAPTEMPSACAAPAAPFRPPPPRPAALVGHAPSPSPGAPHALLPLCQPASQPHQPIPSRHIARRERERRRCCIVARSPLTTHASSLSGPASFS